MTLEVALFLSMNGNAGEAISFYKKHFDAKERLLVTYADLAKRDPEFSLTEENKQFISHSVLQIGSTKLMIAEEQMNPSELFKVGNHVSLCIQSANLTEITEFYTSLLTDKRVKIILPLNKNIFSEAYGIVEDPFGIQIQLMYDDRLK